MMPQELFAAKSGELDSHVDELKQLVVNAIEKRCPIHETEEQVLRVLLKLGRASLELLLASLGPGDVGETHELSDHKLSNRDADLLAGQNRSVSWIAHDCFT